MGCIAQPMEELDTGSNGNLPSITGGAERRRQDGMECPKFLSTHVNNELNGLAVCIANKISTQRPATISPHRTNSHTERVGYVLPSTRQHQNFPAFHSQAHLLHPALQSSMSQGSLLSRAHIQNRDQTCHLPIPSRSLFLHVVPTINLIFNIHIFSRV